MHLEHAGLLIPPRPHISGCSGKILPRVLAGCLLGAFIAEILPHEKVSRSLGPESGLKGLLIGTAFGAILPGGPFTAYPVAAGAFYRRSRFLAPPSPWW